MSPSSRTTRRALVAGLAATTLLAGSAVTGATATAAERGRPGTPMPRSYTIAKDLLSPLSLAVSRSGTKYFTENFKGTLWMKNPGRAPEVAYQTNGAEAGAVSERNGTVTFAVSRGNNAKGFIKQIGNSGRAYTIARTHEFEAQHNPDGANVYGIPDLDEECAAQWPAESFGPHMYNGIPETHPYASLTTRNGVIVADAGANAIFEIDRRGRMRTLAVLPPVPVMLTEEFQEAYAEYGVPECVVGHYYHFEPVPTDVEMGRNGKLYVTSLPGGPEDGSLGALGSVMRVNPLSGNARTVVTGLISPTGLATLSNGDMYVAELFAGRFSKIKAGRDTAVPWVAKPLPGDIEVRRGRLFGTIKVLTGLSGKPGDAPAGKVIRIRR